MPTQSSQLRAETSPRTLLAQIEDNGWFRHLQERIKYIQRLQQAFAQIVAKELAQQCQILEFQNGKLTLAASHAGWATQVRYAAPELIKQLKTAREFQHLIAIHCLVQPDSKDIQVRTGHAPNPIAPEQARCLAEVAKGIKDERLSKALLRLAGTKIPSPTAGGRRCPQGG